MFANPVFITPGRYSYLVYTKTVDSVFRALSMSDYPALFTDSPPVPTSERRQTRVSCKMPSRFTAVTNKEISRLIKQAVSEIHEKSDEARGGSFHR